MSSEARLTVFLPAVPVMVFFENGQLEIRVLRTNEIGRVQRLKITKGGVVKSELLCLDVGATKATRRS